MKKYIFITMNIGGINGAEQYIYNKINYLEEQGYEVFVFSGRPSEKILIDRFRKYERLSHPALRFYPSALSQRERAKIFSWFQSVVDIHPKDTCVVESSNIISSLWGELLAQRLGCRHFAMNLTEKPHVNASIRKFLEFKVLRHELAGIFDNSVSTMLNQPDLPLRPDMRIRAYCSNVVQDCENHFAHLLDSSAVCTIGSIGRLEKEYVPYLIEELAVYFETHRQNRYNLLLIGGCADKRRLKWIQSRIGMCSNVNLVLTGVMYPISRSLIRQATVFLSASGSATVSYYEGIPSISIIHTNAKPRGIIGYDYQLRDGVPAQPLKDRTIGDCIDQILSGSVSITYLESPNKAYQDKMYAEFNRQQTFGQEISELEYYPVLNIHYSIIAYRLCAIICRIFGTRITYAVLEFFRKIVRGFEG